MSAGLAGWTIAARISRKPDYWLTAFSYFFVASGPRGTYSHTRPSHATGEASSNFVSPIKFGYFDLPNYPEYNPEECQRLLAEAEAAARQLGARNVMLDTFDWQAEAFYLRQGYTVYGRLPDCPPGHERIYLRKPLSGS